ncbi:MAG: tail fiber domain-containing protein [Ignavibacteria bacterium]|nr:tail fiber domain-containing protein [Ignavibacteria bacterium]
MKTLFIAVSFFISATVFSQSITNTLGTSGVFTIKDASNNFLTLSQSTGQVNILNSLRLENTTNSNTGIIFKGTDRFIHNYPNSTSYNTFMGINGGNFTLSSAIYNTGIGHSSLSNLTTGFSNTALGYRSLNSNSSGYSNTALGFNSLFSNVTGSENTAVGLNSLYSNTGNSNTALGVNSLASNVTGTENTAVGLNSLFSNTGNYNTALGVNSLYSNTSGSENTSIGNASLNNNTTGNFNTAVGSSSLRFNTGFNNTAVGYQSLANNTGFSNTAMGYQSLLNNTSGIYNTAVGQFSLFLNNTGNRNTTLGYLAGGMITTGSNLTLIGYDAQASSGTATNQITLGDGNVNSLRCNTQTITSLSDARDKNNIQDLSLGLDFLMKVKPRMFNWDKREWYENNISDGSKMKNTPTAGFIAQELDEVQTTENAEWLNLVLKDNPEKLEATYGNLLPVMVKAIQELKDESEKLKAAEEKLRAENTELKNENIEMKDRLSEIEQTQNLIVSEFKKLKLNENNITLTKSEDKK